MLNVFPAFFLWYQSVITIYDWFLNITCEWLNKIYHLYFLLIQIYIYNNWTQVGSDHGHKQTQCSSWTIESGNVQNQQKFMYCILCFFRTDLNIIILNLNEKRNNKLTSFETYSTWWADQFDMTSSY